MDEQLRREDPNVERINVPANSRHYWRYRMHITLEQLAEADEFNRTLTDMIAASGRK
jgi:4-alpha-glucanotransferase